MIPKIFLQFKNIFLEELMNKICEEKGGILTNPDWYTFPENLKFSAEKDKTPFLLNKNNFFYKVYLSIIIIISL